eukprot:6492384-Amphidinium_carterae.17
MQRTTLSSANAARHTIVLFSHISRFHTIHKRAFTWWFRTSFWDGQSAPRVVFPAFVVKDFMKLIQGHMGATCFST